MVSYNIENEKKKKRKKKKKKNEREREYELLYRKVNARRGKERSQKKKKKKEGVRCSEVDRKKRHVRFQSVSSTFHVLNCTQWVQLCSK